MSTRGGGGGGNRGGQGRGRGTGPSRGGSSADRGRGAGNFRGGGPDRGGGYRGGGGGGRGGGRGGGGRVGDDDEDNKRRDYRDQYEDEANPTFTPGDEALQPPDADVERQENALIRKGEEISLSGLSLDDVTLPSRPSYGTQGRAIVLRTNYFKMVTKPGAVIHRYDIKISPQIKNPKVDTVNRRKTRRLIELVIASNPPLQSAGVATDYGKFFVTGHELKLGETGSRVITQKFWEAEDDGPRPQATTHQITISNKHSIPVQELLDYLASPPGITSTGFDKGEVIQVLNIIMTRTAEENRDIYGGGDRKKYYTIPPENAWFTLGGGLIAAKGFYTSVRTSTLRVLLNINVANAAFYAPIQLLGVMRLHTRNRQDDANSGLEAFISRLKVSHRYIRKGKEFVKRVKTVQGFAHPSAKYKHDFTPLGNARQIKFECAELQATGKVSVLDYFKGKYNIDLQDPDEPVINVGSREIPSFVPPELLWVEPGQQYGRKLDGVQTDLMLKFAVRKPAENARRIVDQGAKMMALSTTNQNLLAFGIQVPPRMITVRARILPPVPVQYKSANRPKTFQTYRASWNIMGGRHFSDARQLRNWTLIRFVNNRIDDRDITNFRGILRESGMNSDEPTPPNGVTELLRIGKAYDEFNDQKVRAIMEKAVQNRIKFLLIILPDKNAFIYSRVKYWAEVKNGIHTVCSVGEKFHGGDKPFGKGTYWANLAHKFNLKLGGVNQTLPSDKLGILADGKTMLAGMDVTHPSPGSIEGAPSIAGIVASIDGRYGQWPGSIRTQKGRKEMIEDLDKIFGERLDLWRKNNRGGLPTRIFIYRDGVSEGQYRTMLQDELPQIQKACEIRYPGGRLPKISVIVCGKRHHTRFYPTADEHADGAQKNPPNGTVVDRGITMEKGWDFYMQAHASALGTARPTHYVIIYDKNGMNADQMEGLTHNLCYLYGRATKAVSLCPPAYFADLICERGRAYLYGDFNARDNATSTSAPKWDENRAAWLRGVHPSIQDSMFYV
ncbi:MAG: hypothetical protein Q9170_001919 [Blastenia crenularia]